MNRILILLLICALLCGCSAAGTAPQMAASSTAPADKSTNPTSPQPTLQKNPGLTVDPYDPDDKIPQITENRIRQDYCDAHDGIPVDEVKLRCMGVFHGVYVMFIDVRNMMYADVITTDNVGGFRFVYSCSQRMQVWCDGQFYSLQQAYEAELLTQDDLRLLSQAYYEAFPYLNPISAS